MFLSHRRGQHLSLTDLYRRIFSDFNTLANEITEEAAKVGNSSPPDTLDDKARGATHLQVLEEPKRHLGVDPDAAARAQ